MGRETSDGHKNTYSNEGTATAVSQWTRPSTQQKGHESWLLRKMSLTIIYYWGHGYGSSLYTTQRQTDQPLGSTQVTKINHHHSYGSSTMEGVTSATLIPKGYPGLLFTFLVQLKWVSFTPKDLYCDLSCWPPSTLQRKVFLGDYDPSKTPPRSSSVPCHHMRGMHW